MGYHMHLIFAYIAAALAAFSPALPSAAGDFQAKGAAVVYEQSFEETKKEPWGKPAAIDLAKALSKVTDSDVKAYPEGSAPKGLGRVIYVGRPVAARGLDVSAFDVCEFRVKVTEREVFLVGRTETAASYAVTEFLERFCGYRFLAQSGDDPYERNPSLTIPECDFTRKSAIPYRHVYRCCVQGMLSAADTPKTAANFHAFARRRRLTIRNLDRDPSFRVRRIDGTDCHLVFKYLPTKMTRPRLRQSVGRLLRTASRTSSGIDCRTAF